jgi:hypothetical protein
MCLSDAAFNKLKIFLGRKLVAAQVRAGIGFRESSTMAALLATSFLPRQSCPSLTNLSDGF